jgi:hypothetical protein
VCAWCGKNTMLKYSNLRNNIWYYFNITHTHQVTSISEIDSIGWFSDIDIDSEELEL